MGNLTIGDIWYRERSNDLALCCKDTRDDMGKDYLHYFLFRPENCPNMNGEMRWYFKNTQEVVAAGWRKIGNVG
jgi:hypothetical protein